MIVLLKQGVFEGDRNPANEFFADSQALVFLMPASPQSIGFEIDDWT